MSKFKLKLNRNDLFQVILTIFSFIFTILIPLISYIQFKSINPNQVDLGGLDTKFDILIIFFFAIGIIITICTYLVYQNYKYSTKRSILLILISIMYIVYIASSSQIMVLYMGIQKIEIIIDFSGILILFLIGMGLFTLKNVIDLIDFKVNQSYYYKILRNSQISLSKRKQRLIKCSNCKYMCRLEWKKCPICNKKFKKKKLMF